jgi:hypothetical protein
VAFQHPRRRVSTASRLRNLQGAHIVPINDVATFSEGTVIDAFNTVRKSNDKSFKLVVGHLDKTSAQEAQQEQDNLLLHREKYGFSAESDDEPADDDNDDDVSSPSSGPMVPPPFHERNVSVPTPGVRRSWRLQAKEKEAANLTIQSIMIKPHHLLDIDPFDKSLDNHDHINDVPSKPEVISVEVSE